MKSFLHLAIFLLTAAIGIAETVPDQRDQQVLEATILHLLADPNFDPTRNGTNTTTIFLHDRNPEKTGFLSTSQIHIDLRTNTLPEDLETNLRRRNTPAGAKPYTYDTIPASYTNLTFASPIIVTNLAPTWKRQFDFRKTFPETRAWLEAYLPGYSNDGTLAIIRASVGPTPHGATLTAFLKKVGNKWSVQWYRIAYYV